MAKSTFQYSVSGTITNLQGEAQNGLTIRAFDQDFSKEDPLGQATTDENGKYQITYTDQDFRIGGKESGGADIIVRVYDGDTLLKETEPLRNAGREVTIDVTVEKPVKEEPPQPVLTAQQQVRLHNLSEAIFDQKLRASFEATFTETKGDFTATMATLSQKKEFDDFTLKQLSFTHDVAELSGDHAPLVTAFRLNDTTNSLRDIALGFNRVQLTDFVRTTGVPEGVEGETEGQRLTAYSGQMYTKLFQAEPTAMIQRMVASPVESPIADKMMSGTVATFLSNQPAAFNIKTTSIYEAFKAENAFKDIAPELKDGVVTQLKSLQRVAALSPVPEAMPVLMNANMTSALQVSDLPEQQFIQAFSKHLGEDGAALAQQIHTNAVNSRIRNEHALIALKELGQGTGIAMIDKSLDVSAPIPVTHDGQQKMMAQQKFVSPQQKVAERLQHHNLSWDLLFGDADFCECGECNSVYSAAAYFVELLQYLRNNNLDPNNPNVDKATGKGKAGYAGTPMEKLFDRRPDLGCLELTCKNTNTILPYVDLVNEVMENYVVFKHPKPFNVEDETSGELLAQPQHTEYQAYCILKDEVYPCTLPYHQPIDAARIDLEFLGTSRTELIDTFRSPRKVSANPDPAEDCDTDMTDPAIAGAPAVANKILDKLHEAYINRAVDAEYLGLTQEEYVILTKEAFVSKEYWDKQCNATHTLEEYRTKIGVKPVHEYYGYETPASGGTGEAEMLDAATEKGLTFVKKQFLRRTGIQYTDLVELLLTQCLNPNMPRGWAKFITDSLHFSYRFLQHFKAANGEDKLIEVLTNSEQLIQLAPQLEDFVTFFNFENKRSDTRGGLACPPANEEENAVSKTDLKNWVKCYFEKIGKMIVLENGGKCSCMEGKFLHIIEGKSIPPTIFTLNSKCELKDERTDTLIGNYNCSTGEVTTKDPAMLDRLKGFTFQASDGSKNFFWDANRLLNAQKMPFSSSFQSKDTCDLDTVRLIHLDGSPVTVEEYDHIHRFIRLWRKLGWTIDEIDKSLAGLSASKGDCLADEMPGADDCNDCGDLFDEGGDCKDSEEEGGCAESGEAMSAHCDITPEYLHQLVAVKKLLEKTGLELTKLLPFWTEISTEGEKSLYKRLFLTHNLLGMDKVFKADKNGNYLTQAATISEHQPVIMAAFNLSADDMDAIVKSASLADKLTLANLSLMYRYRLLSKALGLKIPAFIEVLPLFGNPFKDADATLEFMERWGKMEDAGFNYRQLNYIIRDFDDPKKPLSPTEKTVLQLAKTLYDGLNAIDEAHKDLTANPATTDAEQQKLEIQAQATLEFVRSKAALLFDPSVVEQMTGILEGTSVFITNAPQNLIFTIPEKKSLKKKLKYDKTGGTVQITGILTEAERIDFIALSNDGEWGKALIRLEKQRNKLFKAVLHDVFEAEKATSEERKTAVEAAEKTIKGGDISIAFDQIPESQADTNTAVLKRIAFLAVFLPYLRQQLTHRFVVDTLSGLVGLQRETTDVLISEVLNSGTPPLPVYGVFEKIKDSAKPSASDWHGYLIPASEGDFTFIVKNGSTTTGPSLSMDGITLAFEQQEDPTNEWWSKPQKLQAGKLYKLSVTGIDMKNVYWKTATSSISSLPPSALLPDFASAQCTPAFVLLKKAALLVSGFNLSADEIRYFNGHQTDFGGLNFNQVSLEQWLRLEAYTRFRNSLPETKTNILTFFNWTMTVQDPAAKATLSAKIAELTLWKKERIDNLIKTEHFNLDEVAKFHNEENLLVFQHALTVADKIGMDIDLLFDWAKPTSNFKKCRSIADSIEKAIRAQYKQTDWEQVVKPLSDKLRNNQKDALIAYLLQRPELLDWGVTDADGLFEYFLIDVQMDACMETSRIKQAISSVQLFVMRCFLGLEEKKDANGVETGVSNQVLDRPRWEWMERYRVWEANRKIFLYPENWIESNLRDDKSPFFKELESELLQKDINKQNVTDALKSYLYKVDEVANMEVIGLYIEDDDKKTVKKLHVFSRTRNAPYFFYYRYFDIVEGNWYAWEKMQVDITSYDVTNGDGLTTANGCYLTPVVWNGRLLVFFPQIMKKTKPNPKAPSSGKFNDLAESSTGVEDSKPIEYFEIKMAWSEYRNGKWTQKQLSKDVLSSDPIGGNVDIHLFKFIPFVSKENVLISFDDRMDVPFNGGFAGTFIFEGSNLKVYKDNNNKNIVVGTNEPITINFFNKDNIIFMHSWQIKDGKLENKDLFFANRFDNTTTFKGLFNTTSSFGFYHSFSHKLLGKLNLGELEAFFKFNLSSEITDKNEAFGGYYKDIPHTYHELNRPYSLYNWELFFHTPTMLADALSKAQQFEEAMKWYHFVFSPLADGAKDNRFWQFSPFKETDTQNILDSIFNNLQPNEADQKINDWRNHPFMPHWVARDRPVAYMKWVVMKYIDNLVAWGDYLFRQDTIESINQATQLYVLAGHVLGPRPMMIPKRGKIKPQTYLGLLDKWDAFGNAMVELELAAPYSNQITTSIGSANGVVGLANIFGFSTALYFCIPNNPKLMAYWDTIADRLFKIRHCENIEGVFRMLPLFEPPIDPALLVRAAAQGLSIASVLNDLNTPMPNYRFYYLLQKALELCGELKSLGGAMLSAMEKKDNEAIALMRAKHESTMHNLMMEVKKKQLEEAEKSLETLEQNRIAPEARMRYYLKLSGLDESLVPNDKTDFNGLPNEIVTVDGDSGLKLIPFEKEDMDKSSEASDWQIGIGIVETLGNILHAFPNITFPLAPPPVALSSSFGGSNLGSAIQALARGLRVYSDHLSYQSSNAGKKAGFTRALQERIQQASAAGFEIKQIDKQITAQQVRIEMANLEISNQQKQIDNANEIEEFLKNKYTNEELYVWMRGSLKTLHHQVYVLAYELAKKAEKVFRFERGLNSSNIIQSGYWEEGYNGLLSGERLFVSLKQLEAAYQENRGYDYEITKHISLRQINPLAVLQLRETGKCEFDLPEVLFDMDFPGHFKRRIKSVSVSIPCVAGPYTGLNGTLRLLENRFRHSAIAKDKTDYLEKTDQNDERFMTFIIPIAAIAASSAQNDSGMFELNFKDERYLPFEGAGTISKWRLELPSFRQFDYDTISDVVVHVRYTAVEGGERLKKAAGDTVTEFMKANEDLGQQEGLFSVIDLIHDLPNAWHKAMQVSNLDKQRTLSIDALQDFLPYFIKLDKDGKPRDISKVKVTDVVLVMHSDLQASDVSIMQADNEIAFSGGVTIGTAKSFVVRDDIKVGNWQLVIKNMDKAIDKALMVVRFVCMP